MNSLARIATSHGVFSCPLAAQSTVCMCPLAGFCLARFWPLLTIETSWRQFSGGTAGSSRGGWRQQSGAAAMAHSILPISHAEACYRYKACRKRLQGLLPRMPLPV